MTIAVPVGSILLTIAMIASLLEDWRGRGAAALEAKWTLLFPVLLILSIRSGLFTPSEVGAFAVVCAILVGTIAHRAMDFDAIRRPSAMRCRISG